MKILNCYCGIGGNRKLWDKEHTGEEHEIVGVELNPQIARIYQDFFPQDKVIVADAHQYLLEHFGDFDFVWSSPPCPSHTKMNMVNGLFPHKDNTIQIKHGGGIPPRFPDMKLYEEIIFCKYWFKGKWCVENVISYYEPLIKPQEIAKHYFWTNFLIKKIPDGCREHHAGIKKWQERKGFNLEKYGGIDKRAILRNCVEPEVGLHILNSAIKEDEDLFTHKEE